MVATAAVSTRMCMPACAQALAADAADLDARIARCAARVDQLGAVHVARGLAGDQQHRARADGSTSCGLQVGADAFGDLERAQRRAPVDERLLPGAHGVDEVLDLVEQRVALTERAARRR